MTTGQRTYNTYATSLPSPATIICGMPHLGNTIQYTQIRRKLTPPLLQTALAVISPLTTTSRIGHASYASLYTFICVVLQMSTKGPYRNSNRVKSGTSSTQYLYTAKLTYYCVQRPNRA